MQLLEGTRLIKTRASQRDDSYELINNRLGKNYLVNSKGAKLIRSLNLDGKFNTKYSDFYDDLKKNGFLVESTEPQNNIYLCDNKKIKYPLSCLNVELTNKCNFRCIHCYGDFGHFELNNYVNLKWFKEHLTEFNLLNIKSFSLTGGESTLNPDFLDIAVFLLESGFELCIFTNGFNYTMIQKLLDLTKKYRYTIKVSLDGFATNHELIRGRKDCFVNVIKTIDEIYKYENVTLYISSVLMKQNMNEMNEFENWIKNNYPRAIHSINLIFPSSLCSEQCFFENDFDIIYNMNPNVFNYLNKQVSRKVRCSGGISQCTLMPNGKLKICNSACNEMFYFKYNAFLDGLSYSWNNCGDNINKIRKEKRHRTKDCKKCTLKKKCNNTDCRIIAYNYTNEDNRSNPITCYITKKGVINNEKMGME